MDGWMSGKQGKFQNNDSTQKADTGKHRQAVENTRCSLGKKTQLIKSFQ